MSGAAHGSGGHLGDYTAGLQPPPYSYWDSTTPDANARFGHDSRESSSQSLLPSESGDQDPFGGRRRLLVIYIHGFYGNDQSFQSFPAHVHGYLKAASHETHVVHSKIYPRYKTYKSIDIAVENFSAWLQPHENADTDVVLVGHSMGGILAAEVVLLPNKSPYSPHPYRHRILGTINMDCPFLGLHPGIIVAGLSSLFRPTPSEPNTPGADEASATLSPMTTNTSAGESGQLSHFNSTTSVLTTAQSSQLSPQQSVSSLPATPEADPHFNQPFFNDKAFRERPFKQRLVHFVKKHSSEGVFGAARRHVLSHLEYGGCLADYPALHNRYNRLRALENVDELASFHQNANSFGASGNRTPARVRFVNYYTISTGIVKPAPTPTEQPEARRSRSRSPGVSPAPSQSGERQAMQLLDPVPEPDEEPPKTPEIHVQSPGGAEKQPQLPVPGKEAQDESKGEPSQTPGQASSLSLDGAVAGHDENGTAIRAEQQPSPNPENDLDLPAIPDAPAQPTPPDLDKFKDDDARKQAEKEFKRTLKAYEQAVKAREKTIKERQRIVDKRRKKLEKERAKQEKETEKLRAKQEKERQKQKADTPAKPAPAASSEPDAAAADPAGKNGSEAQAVSLNETHLEHMAARHDDETLAVELEATETAPGKPAKERKFCVLPRKSDDTWVSVFMEGVDEVGAHCGLFVQESQHYDGLVGDVGHRILEWLQEHMSKETVMQMSRDAEHLSVD